ncbi:hypothetical protein [Lacipirellula sp.]|uniref:hypothetical protein n=1 Tax=Lacipirellula sp. TaxID=2691419 RepID=UPI003D0CC1E4
MSSSEATGQGGIFLMGGHVLRTTAAGRRAVDRGELASLDADAVDAAFVERQILAVLKAQHRQQLATVAADAELVANPVHSALTFSAAAATTLLVALDFHE